MKQAFSLLVISLIGAQSSFAQSMLKVSLTDHTPIKVAVDGRYFNKRGESVTVGDLPQGRHYLKIFTLVTTRRGTQMDEVLYEGKIKTYRGQLTNFIYNPNNSTAEIVEQDINNDLPSQPGYSKEDQESFNNRNLNNFDTRDNNTTPNNDNPIPDKTTDNTTNNDYTPPPALPAGTPLASPVSPNDELDALEKGKPVKDTKTTKAAKPLKDPKLEKARKKVAAKHTDTDKLTVAKQVFGNEKLTTAQVSTIITWFDFENSKVDFAKWAYPNTTDKNNFKKVKAGLTMKNYRDDMDKFLKSQGGK